MRPVLAARPPLLLPLYLRPLMMSINWESLIPAALAAIGVILGSLWTYLQKRAELANERAKTAAANQEIAAIREQGVNERAADMLLKRVDALEVQNGDLQKQVYDLAKENGQLQGSVKTLSEQQTNTINSTTIIIGRLQERVRQNTEQIKAYQLYLDDLISSLDKEDGETKSRILGRVSAHPPTLGKSADTQRLEEPST